MRVPSQQRNSLYNTSEWEALGNSEVLILDKSKRIHEELGTLLQSSNMMITHLEDEQRALSLTSRKHFAVALLDVDTPSSGQGFNTMAQMKVISPATEIILLVAQPTFEMALKAFHGGAADVIPKTSGEFQTLPTQLQALCLQGRRLDERDRLLREILDVHEQFLKKLMEASRRLLQAQETGQAGAFERWELKECIILVVDENPRTASGLQEALGGDSRYRCVSALNGGEALDYAGQNGFQIALVSDQLPDLPWRTVVKSLRGQDAGGIVLLFTNPPQGLSRVSIIEENQTIDLIPELNKGTQLVDAIYKLREAYVAKMRERYYLQAFRQENYDFLKRYAELRQRITVLLPSEVK
jgi:DNA-binding NtrC family response regulator